MTKTSLLALLTFGVLLSGCSRLNPSENPSTPNDQNTPATQESLQKEIGEWASAIARGDSLKCQISSSADEFNGEYFIKGKKFRLNANQQVETQPGITTPIQTVIISDEKFMYSFDTSSKQGIKFSLDTNEATEEKAQIAENLPDFSNPENLSKEILEENFSIDCEKDNSIADSLFVPPSDIVFNSFDELKNATDAFQQSQQTPLDEESKAKLEEMLKQYQQ